MWLYIVQGIGYGFAAAVQPGPFQTYLISQSLTKGWQRALPAALAPLMSDGPVIALCLFVLSEVPRWLERFLYIAGGLFVLYLAYGAYKAWKNFDPRVSSDETEIRRGVFKAAFINVLSPGPYIYWTLVTGPILLRGWRETPMNATGFLAGFYVAMILSLSMLIIAFGSTRQLGPKVNRVLRGISAMALFFFGLFQLWKGTMGS